MTVNWGHYGNYEGPWTPGAYGFVLPDSPTFADEVLAVITATEGGHWDAINRYDSCIDTQGLIQWCNRAPQCSVDGLYSALYSADPALIKPATDFYGEHGYSFSSGHWEVNGEPVNTPSEQVKLYFKGATGARGEWEDKPDSKAYAMAAVEASARVWQNPLARKVQAEWTVKRLDWFVISTTVKGLFSSAPVNPVGRAFKAMYWSFAANNPVKASQAMLTFLARGVLAPWTVEWLAGAAQHLVFDPGIAIYPTRYNKIRPVLEKLYGIDLPDYASEIDGWLKQQGLKNPVDPVEIQRALIALGYDLGPAGADGSVGKKTTAAMFQFETDAGVQKPDGLMDPAAIQLLEQELEKRGVQDLA